MSSGYTFRDFAKDVEWRVRRLARTVQDPDFMWPGVLVLDAPGGGLSAEAFEIGPTVVEQRELVNLLVAVIQKSGARRFAWIMPCLRDEPNGQTECLLLVVGESGRAEAAVAALHRATGTPPRLGRFSFGAFGGGARRISGRFVEPLLTALDEEQTRAREVGIRW